MSKRGPPEWDLLLSAAQKNDAARIRMMIEQQGVNPSYGNMVGQTALHVAALWGNVEAVQALLDAGADVHLANRLTGATPLHMVAQSRKGTVARRLQVMELLLAAGANPSQPDQRGQVPADLVQRVDTTTAAAAASGDASNIDEDAALIPQLLQRLQPKPPALFQAMQDRNVPAVEQWIQEQGEQNQQPAPSSSEVGETETNSPPVSLFAPFRGVTPVCYAVQQLVDLLENTNSHNDNTPQEAEFLVDILLLLVQAGADVTAETEEEIPLHQLLQQLQQRMPKDEEEVEPSSISNWQVTALKRAIEGMLQSSSAATSSKNDDTADTADTTTNTTPTSILPADGWQFMQRAARRNQVAFVRYLIETLQLDPNVPGRQNMTALQFAARSGQMHVLRYLLGLPNINVHIADDRGQTALDAARVNQKTEAVEALEAFLQRTADNENNNNNNDNNS